MKNPDGGSPTEMPDTCLDPECGAPAAPAWEWVFTTSDGVAPGARIVCAVGHWYTWVGESVHDPFLEGPSGSPTEADS